MNSNFDIDGHSMEANALIYPDLLSAGQYLIEVKSAGELHAVVALQLLNEGFAASTTVLICVAFASFVGVAALQDRRIGQILRDGGEGSFFVGIHLDIPGFGPFHIGARSTVKKR
jgi:hypothetical protein